MDMEYRVEDKYLVTEENWMIIESRLKHICEPDIHGVDGIYNIRSIYFDDMYDTGLMQNEAGTDEREKFRIRAYDMKDDIIQLELKSKLHGFTRKRSVKISRTEAERLFNMDDDLYLDNGDYLIIKLCSEMKYRRMQPVILIEYERKAYTYDAGNVRITYDKNIGAGTEFTDIWDSNTCITPVLPVGQHIMEVKYDELLPDHIRSVLDIGDLQRISYSKYYYARTGEYV